MRAVPVRAVLLSAQGHPLDQLVDILRVDRDAGSRTLDRWAEGGVAALEEGGRPGRSPTVDAALAAAVLASAAGPPASRRRVLAKKGRESSPAADVAPPQHPDPGQRALSPFTLGARQASRVAATGLRLLFLPPYCPHLNRLETLWRLVKHHWLPTSAYESFATLREHVTNILDPVGLNYRVNFS